MSGTMGLFCMVSVVFGSEIKSGDLSGHGFHLVGAHGLGQFKQGGGFFVELFGVILGDAEIRSVSCLSVAAGEEGPATSAKSIFHDLAIE